MTKLLKCGDTEWCENCTQSQDLGETRFLHENNLGRCDFYNGPDKIGRHRSAPPEHATE